MDNDNSLLNAHPPEDIAARVRQVLTEAIDAAIENWNEGYWADFTTDTTVGEVLGNLGGYIESYLELETEDMAAPLMEETDA